jgi:hypothetical protein
MARQLSQKTFKLEIELTVRMDEIETGSTDLNGGDGAAPSLKALQQALAQNDALLRQQMLAAAFSKLQEYSDYLAGQDAISSIEALAAAVAPDDQAALGLTRADFIDATRPLRVASLTARVDGSQIHEKVGDGEDCPQWQPVWSDLRPRTEFGQLLEDLAVPSTPLGYATGRDVGHYLQVRYLSGQPDGVHLDGRCTCGAAIGGVGADEPHALAAAWKTFQKHRGVCQISEKMALSLKGSFTINEQ